VFGEDAEVLREESSASGRVDHGLHGADRVGDAAAVGEGEDGADAPGPHPLVQEGETVSSRVGGPWWRGLAVGLVLNALVLFDTRYMDAAVNQLRADGFDVRDEDVARLSPFVRHHIDMHGRYSFQPPDLPVGLRPLRDPEVPEDE
jgi:hypothetical protein